MPAYGWSGVVRYGVPGLVLGLACTGMMGGGRAPEAQAQNVPGIERQRAAAGAPGGEAGGTVVFTTSLGGGAAQLLYVIDTKTRAFAIYRVDPANSEGTVKLEAARQYQWDLRLFEYNNQKPEVAAVEDMIKKSGRPVR